MSASFRLISLISIIVALFSCTQLLSADEPQWHVFGELLQGRHHHKAAYLGQGKTLVFGGYVNSTGILGGEPTKNSEIINVQDGTISQGPTMSFARAEFPYVVDSIGNLYVISGCYTNTVEKFDIEQQEWVVVGSLMESRRQHSAGFISRTEILVVAGHSSTTAEIFDIETGISRYVAEHPEYANGLQAIEVDNGDLFFWGAREGGPYSTHFPKGYTYDKDSNVWKEYADFGEGANAPRSIKLRNGSVLICGGETSQYPFRGDKKINIVDQTGTVIKLPPMAFGRQHQELVEWKPNQAIVFGGISDNVEYLTSCEIINTDSSANEIGPSLNEPRAFAASTNFISPDGERVILAISGLRDSSNNNTVEILRLNRSEEQALTNMLDGGQRIILKGSAQLMNRIVDLTSANQSGAGAIWRTSMAEVQEGFETEFSFRINSDETVTPNPDNILDSDGLSFIFQNRAVAPENVLNVKHTESEILGQVSVEFHDLIGQGVMNTTNPEIAIKVGDRNHQYRVGNLLQIKKNNSEGVYDLSNGSKTFFAKLFLRKLASGYELHVYFDTTNKFGLPVIVKYIPDFLSEVNANVFGQTRIGITSVNMKSLKKYELLSWNVNSCTATQVPPEPTGISMTTALPIEVYPQPAGDVCHFILDAEVIHSGNVTIAVSDLLGANVYSLELGFNENLVAIPVSGWASGTYVASISAEGTSYSKLFQVLAK